MKRWFLPVSGDLRAGGTFQLEGNAPAGRDQRRSCRRGQLTGGLELSKQSVDTWVAVVEASGTASADEIAAATQMALAQFAPDPDSPDNGTG